GIYPNGLATSYYWQYGTTTAYGQQTPPGSLAAGAAPQMVSDELAGLSASTTYHYRLVASNTDGTSYGYDFTMTTAAGSPQDTAAPSISGSPREGQKLLASAGAWSPAGSPAYQWQRSANGGASWTSISGETASFYTPRSDDLHRLLRVVATVTNQYGSGSAASGAVGPIASPRTPPARAASVGRRSGRHANARSATAIVSVGRSLTVALRGRKLALVRETVVPFASAASRGRDRGRASADRILVLRRAPGEHGELRARACAVGIHRRGGACTAQVRLTRTVRLRLPEWMRGRVRVVVALTPAER
ncbi:MAG: hypothetical protein ACRDL5_11925, partial [Solirubrobacteraceae bacterium]